MFGSESVLGGRERDEVVNMAQYESLLMDCKGGILVGRRLVLWPVYWV